MFKSHLTTYRIQTTVSFVSVHSTVGQRSVIEQLVEIQFLAQGRIKRMDALSSDEMEPAICV